MKRIHPLLAAIALCLIAGAACATPRPAGGVPTQAAAPRPAGEVPAQAVAAPPQLGGCTIFPADNIWNVPVDKLPVHPESSAYISNINIDETTVHPDFGSFQYGYFGIPYNVVPQNQPKVAVTFQFDDESGEGDTMVVERERDLALSAQARDAVAEIDAALARIAEGTYGYSIMSGRPIPKERLEAFPWSSVLVEEKVGGIGRR